MIDGAHGADDLVLLIIDVMLATSDSMLDPSMKLLISSWSSPPKALEVLEVLDKCIHGSLACGTIVLVLQVLFEETLKMEGLSEDQVVSQAHWRDNYT